jgi:plasmid stabilization system protein ParE
MGWKVIIAPSARADLEGIVRFIARHNSDAAARIGYQLIVRAEGLAAFPQQGRVVPEYRHRICGKSSAVHIGSSITCARNSSASKSFASGTAPEAFRMFQGRKE